MGLDRALLFRLATNDAFERVVTAIPPTRAAAWRAGSRYVAGRTRDEALATASRVLADGHGASVDLFGERVTDAADAERAVDDYLALVDALPAPPADVWLSVDLSHFAVGVDAAGAADRLARVAAALPEGRRIQVGAEELAITDRVLDAVLDVAGRGLADRLGATLQANLLRSPADLERLVDAGVHVRLVKGAYVERTGAHRYGEPTDLAYLRLAHRLGETDAPFSIATHDARLREAVLLGVRRPVGVEQLLGIRPDDLADLRRRGVPTRVYVPYGPDWFRYWLRRVAESRGA